MHDVDKKILDLIINNILNEVSGIDTAHPDFDFLVEKILLNCGLSNTHSAGIINTVRSILLENTKPIEWKSYTSDCLIRDEISKIVVSLFEFNQKMDKIAVRNKQSGAIQLVSKKTYQGNSQIYTPLSAGWAKANVVMVRNKTSGEEYPILLKNFDSNKHEKVGTAKPPEDDVNKSDLKTKGLPTVEPKKGKKKAKSEPPPPGKDTVRPMMVEPSLKAKTQTAFITPKSAQKQSTDTTEFPDNETDIISKIKSTEKDKRLNVNNPLDSKSFTAKDDRDERELYDYLGSIGLLPSDFNINKKFTIPTSITNRIKIPRAYLNTIEQLSNTINGDNVSISMYKPSYPINTNPNALLSLFELLLLYCVTLSDEDFAKFSITIGTFISNNKETNLNENIWNAVKAERQLILSYVIKKYGTSYNLIAGSWKVEEHQIDLGIDNSDIDFEKTSDIFLRIATKDDTDGLEEFLVTPNKSILSFLDKEKFKDYLLESKDNLKGKLLLFLLKIFPVQNILKNQMCVVFPNVIYDYLTLTELFKTESIENINPKLSAKKDNIKLSYSIESDSGIILDIKIKNQIEVHINTKFENKCIELNKKIYKNMKTEVPM